MSARRALVGCGVVWAVLSMISAAGCSGGDEVPDQAPPQRALWSEDELAERFDRLAPEPMPLAQWDALDSRLRITPDPVSHQIQVEGRFRAPSDPLGIQLPYQWAGNRELHRAIRDLNATCDGQELTLEAAARGGLVLHHGGCQGEVVVRYRLVASHNAPPTAGRLRPRMDVGGLLLHGQASLMVPRPSEAWPTHRHSAVEVVAPAEWLVATNWTPVKLIRPLDQGPQLSEGRKVVWRFVAEDLGHLQDSILVAGDLRVATTQLADGRRLQVAARGHLPVSDAQLTEIAKRSVDAQARYLPEGWVWPAGTRRLAMVALGEWVGARLEGSGRRGGFLVEVGARAQPRDLVELVAHEAFHAINGHLLVHHPQAEYDTLWFKEGLTTYIAALTVVRAGYADEAWFRHRMSDLVGSYYGNPLANRLTAPELSQRFWRDANARRLPYDKGALLGLILDASLMTGTRGRSESGLERLLHALLRDVAARGITYDNGTLMDVVAALNHDDGWSPERFWTRFVLGADALPLRSALQKADLAITRGTVLAPYYGFQLGTDPHGTFVSALDNPSPAARAGLLRGDRIVGTPDLDWERPDTPARLTVLRGGRQHTITVNPQRGRRLDYALRPSYAHGNTPRYLELIGAGRTQPMGARP